MNESITTGAAATVAAPRARKTGELVFLGVIIVFSVIAIVMAGSIREPLGSTNILGPRVLPYAVTGLMLITSLIAFVAVLRGDVGSPEDGEDIDPDARTSWGTVALVALAFASLIPFIPLFGWPIAVTVLFTGASLALGAASWWKAALIGVVIAVVTQVLFGTLLGLSLPAFGSVLSGVLGG